MADEYIPGAVVFDGRYRLERIIGTGGMAIVWCATDLRLGRRVAIKVIADTLAADPGYVERFAREARTAAGLSHRSLVSVYDYAAAATRPFLVMELVEGGTLADRIADGPVDPGAARAIARDLLSALECVHAGGILHRDIKPANVLVGSDGRARLTDFGIAHPEDATRLTQTGQLIGTLRYLAPEVIAGERPSPQSDLYALGMLIRELAGERPAGDLQTLVGRLTAADPADRPASAGEALSILSQARATTETRPMPAPAATAPAAAPDAPAAAPAAGPLAPPPRSAGRHFELTPPMVISAAVGLMVLVLVVLALGGGGSGGDATGTTSTATTPTAPPAAITLDERFDQLDALIDGADPDQKR
jgi:serine/threonine protein kinase